MPKHRPLWFRFAVVLYFLGMPRLGARVVGFFTERELEHYRAEQGPDHG